MDDHAFVLRILAIGNKKCCAVPVRKQGGSVHTLVRQKKPHRSAFPKGQTNGGKSIRPVIRQVTAPLHKRTFRIAIHTMEDIVFRSGWGEFQRPLCMVFHRRYHGKNIQRIKV